MIKVKDKKTLYKKFRSKYNLGMKEFGDILSDILDDCYFDDTHYEATKLVDKHWSEYNFDVGSLDYREEEAVRFNNEVLKPNGLIEKGYTVWVETFCCNCSITRLRNKNCWDNWDYKPNL